MTDFLSSLKAGLAAHDQAEADKREIALVVEDLGNQALAVSDDTVTIAILEISRSRTLAEMFEKDGGGFLGGNRVYDALCFQRAKEPQGYRELATWEDEEGGYPVRLSFDGQRFACHDKASLEQTFIRLVQTAAAGKALAELASLKSTPAPEIPADEL